MIKDIEIKHIGFKVNDKVIPIVRIEEPTYYPSNIENPFRNHIIYSEEHKVFFTVGLKEYKNSDITEKYTIDRPRLDSRDDRIIEEHTENKIKYKSSNEKLEQSKSRYYVYKHIRVDNEEVFYIGKGTHSRAYSRSGRNEGWYLYVNKHPYKVEILQGNLLETEALKLERKLIKYYKRAGTLVNRAD